MKNLSSYNTEIVKNNITLKVLKPSMVDERYVNWLNDQQINQYLESRWHAPHFFKDVCDYVEKIYQSKDSLLFGIYYNGNEHVGNIKIGPIDFFNATAYIGYFIGEKRYWGKGLATDAINACCEFGFEELKLAKINAGVIDGNIGSDKVLLKCGFVLEGLLMSMIFDPTTNQRYSKKIYGKVKIN